MLSPRLSVVIPTHNGEATLAACLESLQASSLLPAEVIVVDDASTDGTAEIARRFGCRIVGLDKNLGAARAKNCGAAIATGDILFFTDDDVSVSRDALAHLIENFDNPQVVGVVGLLDRKVPFDGFASHFKNLWMRFTYAKVPRERIGLFYTSVAAMRREVFLQLGGFDENYRGASIAEDTEFGQRAWAAGHRIVLDPRAVVTHCKEYTPREVLATDFLRARALMLLRLRKWGQRFYTSVPLFYQLAVPTIFAALGALLGGAVIGNRLFVILGAALLIAFYVLFSTWLVYLMRERGAGFALIAMLFQPVDVIAVGFGMMTAMLDFVRGVRY